MRIGLGILLICFVILILYGIKMHANVVSVHAITVSDIAGDLADVPNRDEIISGLINNHKQLDDVHEPVGVIGFIGLAITFLMLISTFIKERKEPSNKEAERGSA